MSEKKILKPGSEELREQLEKMKSSLSEQKNDQELLATEEKEKLEKMKDRVSDIAGKFFGEEFKKRIGVSFKKEKEKKVQEILDSINSLLHMKAAAKKWYEDDLNDKDLEDRIKECIIENSGGIKYVTKGKNKSLKKAFFGFIDDNNFESEPKVAEEGKEMKIITELEGEFGRKGARYTLEQEGKDDREIKIISYHVKLNNVGEIDEESSYVEYSPGEKKRRIKKRISVFRDIMKNVKRVNMEPKIPFEIERDFHLYENWIPKDRQKASFRVIKYEPRNADGKFLVVKFDVRRGRGGTVDMSPDELRERIKDGGYEVEDLSEAGGSKKSTKKDPAGENQEEFLTDEVMVALNDKDSNVRPDNGKDLSNPRKVAAAVIEKTDKYKEFNAETADRKKDTNGDSFEPLEEEKKKEIDKIFAEKLRKVFAEMGLAVHGMIKEGEDKTGKKELQLNEKSDLDGRTALFLLRKMGIEVDVNPKTGNVEYVMPGNHAIGKWTFDSGRVDGVEIHKEINEKGEIVISVITDHHGMNSPRDTSAAEEVYRTFGELGMFDEYFERNPEDKEGIEKLIQFVNRIDNLDYPNGKEYFQNYFENSWDTVLGIYRMISPENLLKFFQDGYELEDAARLLSKMKLTSKKLRRYGISQVRNIEDKKRIESLAKKHKLNVKDNGEIEGMTDEKKSNLIKEGIVFNVRRKTLGEYTDMCQMQKERINESKIVLEQMEKDGLIIDSDRFGRIAIDIDKKIPTGPEAAKAFGCEAFVLWQPEYNRFGVNTLGGKELVDADGNLLANKYDQGVEVRKTMWLKSLAEKDEPLNIKLETILQELTDGKFVPTGKLKEYIDNGGKWEEKGDEGADEMKGENIKEEEKKADDEGRKKDEAMENYFASFTGKKKGRSLGEEDGTQALYEEDEVVQLDSRWNEFMEGVKMGEKENERESKVEPIVEPTPAEKPVFEAGKMSVEDFNKLQKELDFSRKLYVGYWCTFEKKKKHLEKYFKKKIGDPNFLGQAQEDMKKLESDYNEKREEYEKEFLANMRKFYQENDKLDGGSLEDAMIQEEYYLKLEESFKKEKIKLEVWSDGDRMTGSFRNILKDKLKGFWNGIWKNTKEKTSAGVDLGRQGAENVRQGVETEMYNIGQNIEIVKDVVETGLSVDKRKRREEILDRRQLGRKKSGVSSQEEAKTETVSDLKEDNKNKKSDSEVDIEIPKTETVSEKVSNIPIIEEKNEISPEAKVAEKVREEDMNMMNFVKKFMNGDLRVWKEYKGKNIKSVIKGSGPQREEKKKFFGNLGRIIDFSREELGKDYMNDNIKVGNWLLQIFTEAERRKKVKEIFEVIESE